METDLQIDAHRAAAAPAKHDGPYGSSARARSQRRAASPALTHLQPQVSSDPIARVTKEAIHWKRKLFHVVGIGTAAVAYALTPVEPLVACAIFGVFAAIFVGLDALRFYVPALNRKVKKDFGPLMRDYELNGFSGSSWFLLAAVLCAGLFSKPAACLGFLCLAIGDPLASWAGLRWGRIRLPGGKSLEGSLTLFAVSAVASVALLTAVFGLGLAAAAAVAVPTALVAAVAEGVPISKRFDDNFVMPIAAAAAAAAVLPLAIA